MPRAKRRDLSQEEREAVLAAFRITPSVRGVARALKLNPATVQYIVNPKEPGKQREQREKLRQPLRTLKEIQSRDKAWDVVGSIMLAVQGTQLLFQEAIDKELPDLKRLMDLSSIGQRLMIQYGIGVEKARLLHNEATSISARVEDMGDRPPQITEEIALLIIDARIHGVHPGLLPEAQPLLGVNGAA